MFVLNCCINHVNHNNLKQMNEILNKRIKSLEKIFNSIYTKNPIMSIIKCNSNCIIDNHFNLKDLNQHLIKNNLITK